MSHSPLNMEGGRCPWVTASHPRELTRAAGLDAGGPHIALWSCRVTREPLHLCEPHS
jgi:hypothetical protein